MVTPALAKLLRERKAREDEAYAEREARRLQEVKAAFYEGMAAGYDRSWLERPADDYWLESDARRDLYAGPPTPTDPSWRAKHLRGHRVDPQRQPSRVIGKSFLPTMTAKKRRKGR